MAEQVSIPKESTFRDDFLFGAAVSAFQVEGEQRHRKTDWDQLLEQHPNIVRPDESGSQWQDNSLAEKDIDLLTSLGIKSLRLSIEWAKIEPTEGKFNREALNYYKSLIRYLREKNIEPLLVLNHFTLPLWVVNKGGWQSTAIQLSFSHYVNYIAHEFTDVKTWITINEPEPLINAGYITGYFPPHKKNIFAALLARENILIAHEEAYRILKRIIPDSKVGLSFAIRWYRPDDPNSLKEVIYTRVVNYLSSLNYIDAAKNSCDFIGCNFYTGYYLELSFKHLHRTMRRDAADIPETLLFGETKKPEAYISDMGWPIVPDFFLDVLRSLFERYRKPIIVTENGIADEDDNYRSFYLLTHLAAVSKAIAEHIPVTGYYYWSAIDNLEWLYGYDKRFGLIEVNPVSGERKIRESAYLYKEIIHTKKITFEDMKKKYLPQNQHKSAEKVLHSLFSKNRQEKCSYCA